MRINGTNQQKDSNTILGIGLLLAVWILLAAVEQEVNGKPFPYPWQAVTAVITPAPMQQSIFLHAGISLVRWLSGFLIAVLIGVPVGLVMGLKPRVSSLLTPAVTSLQLIPGLAWIPITLILFGLGTTSTIFMISATALSPIIINTQAGVHQLDPHLLLAAETMELSRRRVFSKIIIPGTAISLVSGLRTGAANGFRVLISAEMVVGSSLGLGYSLFNARWSLDYETAFGALLVIILIGLAIEKLLFASWDTRVRRRQGVL